MTKVRTILLVIGLIGLAVVWGLAWVSKRIEHVGRGIAPLETRVFDGFQVITLGTGRGAGNPNRKGPSVGVAFREKLLLVDAGAGVTEALRAAEVPVSQPSLLLLTSLLPMNTEGLDELLIARAREAAPDLTVIGPKGTEETVGRIWSSFSTGMDQLLEVEILERPRSPVASDVSDSKTVGDSDLEITWELVGETPAPMLAYSIRHNEKTVLISSRAFDTEAIVDLGLGTDMWIHAAMVREAMEAGIEAGADPERTRDAAQYLTALEDLGALATQMEARSVVLTRPVATADLRVPIQPSGKGNLRRASRCCLRRSGLQPVGRGRRNRITGKRDRRDGRRPPATLQNACAVLGSSSRWDRGRSLRR